MAVDKIFGKSLACSLGRIVKCKLDKLYLFIFWKGENIVLPTKESVKCNQLVTRELTDHSENGCYLRDSIAMKGHHDHGNSYKGRHLIR